MLAISNLSKNYGIKPILSDLNCTVKTGERIGLVGPNGCGKTTLLRILAGVEQADRGSVRATPADLRIGYLPQGLDFSEQETIRDYLNRYRLDLDELTDRLAVLALALSEHPDRAGLQEEYDQLLHEITRAASIPDQSQAILQHLGLEAFEETTPVGYLSGGQKTRLALAGVLLSHPHLLLLDEPTNHLDIEMLEWLEEWIAHSDYTALIVSHDRAFLDHVATGIFEINPLTHQLKEYPGNYTDYLEHKDTERSHQLAAYQEQQEEIGRLREASAHLRGIAKFKKGGKADTGDKFAKGFFANRGLGTVGRAKHIERRIEHLLTDERIERPERFWQMKIEFSEAESSGRDVLVLEDLSIGYAGYQPLATGINLTLRYGQRVAFIGSNGAGKSTLVRTITGSISPVNGRVRLGSNVKIGYMAQEQENLEPGATPLAAIMRILPNSETEARSFLSKYLFKGDDVFTPIENMSYGERSRLSLALLSAQGCNLLILDEPINHLDIPARVRFEEALLGFEGTILAIVHDRYFIQTFANAIWELKEGAIHITS